MIYSPSSSERAFCDWLDVTYAPDNSPLDDMAHLIQTAGASATFEDKRSTSWRLGEGTLMVTNNARWCRISASGAALAYLRGAQLFMDYLTVLSTCPHKITRLDAAMDLPLDGADCVDKLLAAYPVECSLTHKPSRIRVFQSPRQLDNRMTGTFYIGNRRTNKVMARVYDKTEEAFEKRGEILPPTTRVEITVKGDIGPTLRDASEPTSLFYQYASPAILKRPAGIAQWESGWGGSWEYKYEPAPAGGLLKNRVESSADLRELVKLADKAGPNGRAYLLSLIGRYLQPKREHLSAVN